MDQRNRLLAFVTCMGCGLSALAITYACFVHYRHSGSSLGAGTGELSTAGVVPEHGAAALADRIRIERLHTQRAQIKRLQTLLAQQSALLKEKTTVLQQKTVEQEKLRSELGETFDLLKTLLQETSQTTPVGEKNVQEIMRLQANLESMRTQTAKIQEGDHQLQAELELLQAELTASDEQLAQWQLQAAEQVQSIQTLHQAFRGLASEAILSAGGSEAAPVLMSALTHPNVEVRLWAATMLGEIGPSARNAAPALVEALTDDNTDVRLAARHALEVVDMDGSEDGETMSDFNIDADTAFGEGGR